MILEDGAEHQSSLDTALAQPQAQDLVRKFIGDASCRSVEDQADSWVIIRVPPISVFPLSSPIPVLNVPPSPPQLHPGGEDWLEGGRPGRGRGGGGGEGGGRLQHHHHRHLHPGHPPAYTLCYLLASLVSCLLPPALCPLPLITFSSKPLPRASVPAWSASRRDRSSRERNPSNPSSGQLPHRPRSLSPCLPSG